MSINEINPANSLKTGVDSFTGLPGSISDINRELFGQPLSKAPNSAFGSIPMNSLLEADDRSISAIQTKARSGASSVYGNESGIFPIDRAAVQVGKALMDNTITARVPSGDLVDRTGQYDELLNPNPSNLSATVRSGDTQNELGTGSDRRELQKADGNGFTERKAYQLPTGKPKDDEPPIRRELKEGDTLWEIAKEELGDGNRWKEFKKEDGKGFTEEQAYKLQIGTKVYRETDKQRRQRRAAEYATQEPFISFDEKGIIFEFNGEVSDVGINKDAGDYIKDLWVKYYKECLDYIVITEVAWREKNGGSAMTFPELTGKNPKTGALETYRDKPDKKPGFRFLDIVTISKKDGKVTGIEVKINSTEAQKPRSRFQEARDNYAVTKEGQIKDGDTGTVHTPTSVDRVQGMPPDCDEPDSKKPKRNPPPKPPKIDLPARPPAGNEPPREPPKTNPPAGNEPPKTNPPARPPAVGNVKPSEPPKINPPVRPPVRPPALSGALNIGSKIARPLGLVTDVIDLKNAYDEDGGFGKNFQETAGGVAGGWGGAAAGAAAGAALGSVVPGFGTVAGGIVGGVIGGIGGSAAGEGIVKGVRDFFG